MGKKKIIIITLVLVAIILLFSIITSFVILNKNKTLKETRLNVVIYQYHTKDFVEQVDPIIIYKEEFTKELKFSKIIYALDGDKVNDYNAIIISDGIIKVYDADCKDHVCMRIVIDLDNKSLSIVNPNTTTIECKPHGLKITLEEIK